MVIPATLMHILFACCLSFLIYILLSAV